MLCCGKQPGGEVRCEVILLDGSVLSFQDNVHFKKTDKTLKIFEAVCSRLKVEEKDYFGLIYSDRDERNHWLDLYKKFRDHEGFDASKPMHYFHFGVRFYDSDPMSIKDQCARHLFYLQLRKDFSDGKFTCEYKKSAELAGLAAQVDLGDYKKDFHRNGYLSEVKFIPDQDELFIDEVERMHASFHGLSQQNAELYYLKKCRQLDKYGIETHSVRDEYGHDCTIGLSYKGIEVRKNSRKLKTHYWALVSHVEFKDKEIRLQIQNRNRSHSTYVFTAPDRTSCKMLWKRAIEHHEFFRMRAPSQNPHKHLPDSWSVRQENLIGGTTIDDLTRRQWRSSTRSGVSTIIPDTPEVAPRRVENERAQESDGSILDQQGLFGIQGNRKSSRMYITPKSERRARNRHLRSLSDSENKHNRVKSGRSSGEESDSYHQYKSRKHRRSRDYMSKGNGTLYHTDTEALKRNNLDSAGARKRSETESLFHDGRSRPNKLRKAQNRLSREDVRAQRALWQQINKHAKDHADYSPEQLNDIPYTEVKTDGNPLPAHVRKHGRNTTSPRSRRSRSSVTKESISGDYGMVPSLPVTTVKDTTKGGYDTKKLSKSSSKSSLNKYSTDMQVWDTKTTNKRTKS